MEAERAAEAKQAELHRVEEEEQALEERARREAEEEVAALAEILELELEEMIVRGAGWGLVHGVGGGCMLKGGKCR